MTSDVLWILLSTICIAIIFYGLYKTVETTEWEGTKKKTVIFFSLGVVSVWITLLTVLSLNGFFSQFGQLPPRPILAIIVPLPIVLWFSFSKSGTKLIRAVPQQWLVFMQSFRVFVEILLWLAFVNRKLPVQMTFEGGNVDILTGLLALPVGYLLFRKKNYSIKMALAFNTIGIIFLLNILTIAVLSMPSPIRYFMNEPSNAVVGQFPFILLPGILVPIAYSFHIFSLRKLLLK